MSRSLLKQRNFILLWSGQLVSWLGTEVSAIALPLVVLSLTGSPAQAGNVAAIRGIAYVIWAIPAGIVIDRVDRRMIMILANLGSGFAMGFITLGLYYHFLTINLLLIVSAIEGSFFVFANLGRFASFPKVVTKEQFPAASARFGTADRTALLIGPPLGGFLFQTLGGFFAFFIDSLSYFANALSIFFINTQLQSETLAERKAIHHEIKEAVKWFWNQPTLRTLNLITAGRTILASGLYLIIVVLAKQNNASGLSIGLIFAVGAVGGILGTSVAARIHSKFQISQLLQGISILSSIIFSLYFFAANNILLALITALFYSIDPIYDVTTSSYAAKVIPDEIRGRVTGLTRLVVLGAYSLGFFITGVLLQSFGGKVSIGFFSTLLFIIFLVTVFNKRVSRATI